MAGQAASRVAPDARTIEALARAALDRIPEPFAGHLADVTVLVEEFADDEVLREMGIENPFELTGLYQGVPVGEGASLLPNRITLYRRPLLDEWVDTGVALDALITHVVVHEVGHHFGLSDDDMHALEEAVGDDEPGAEA